MFSRLRILLLAAIVLCASQVYAQDQPVPASNTITLPVQAEQNWYTVFETLFHQYPTIGALSVLVILDIVSGLLAGGMKGKLSSIVSFRGMCGKAMIFAIVATGRVIEFIIPGVPWSQFLALGFCVTEAISINENATGGGLQLPQQWTDALTKLTQRKANSAKDVVADIESLTSQVKETSFRKPHIDQTGKDNDT